MYRVAIADLKAHLSAHIKRVRAGETIVILDLRQPVARIVPLETGLCLSRAASARPRWRDFEPLMETDPLKALEAERADSR